MIKRLVTLIISPLMLISLFIVPVYASSEDYSYLAIDRESYSAYEYFQNLGASLDDQNINTTYSETVIGNLGGCLYVPSQVGTITEGGNIDSTHVDAYTITLTGCSSGASNVYFTNYDADRVRYVKPTLHLSNYTAPSTYQSSQALMIRSGEDFVLGLEYQGNLATDSVGIISSNNNNVLIEEVRLIEYNAPWRRYRIVLHNYDSSGWAYINLQFASTFQNFSFTPLYLGHLNNMSDDMGRLLGYETGVARLIDQGTSTSQSSGNALENENTTFTSSSSQLFQFENSFTGQMDSAMNQINLTTSGGLLSVSGFTNALIWVVNQFNSLISPAPIQGALLLILTFGLAMFLIGLK